VLFRKTVSESFLTSYNLILYQTYYTIVCIWTTLLLVLTFFFTLPFPLIILGSVLTWNNTCFFILEGCPMRHRNVAQCSHKSVVKRLHEICKKWSLRWRVLTISVSLISEVWVHTQSCIHFGLRKLFSTVLSATVEILKFCRHTYVMLNYDQKCIEIFFQLLTTRLLRNPFFSLWNANSSNCTICQYKI